ncbi:hypothetical protein cyc_09055, partial [Cyclospora cayetanensis]
MKLAAANSLDALINKTAWRLQQHALKQQQERQQQHTLNQQQEQQHTLNQQQEQQHTLNQQQEKQEQQHTLKQQHTLEQQHVEAAGAQAALPVADGVDFDSFGNNSSAATGPVFSAALELQAAHAYVEKQQKLDGLLREVLSY